MIRIGSTRSFEKYGICVLTGEACAYMLRLLCDVNEDGITLLQNYFSVNIAFSPNWNSKVNGKPAIGSIMLPHGDFWKELARFVIWHVEKCDYMVEECGECVGLKETDEYIDNYKLYSDSIQRNPNLNQPQRDGRNVHAFTGRDK